MSLDAPLPVDFVEQSRELYRDALLNDVIPFWLRHGVDRTYGGLGNILDDRGHTVGSDKYLWSQGRALWTFSALCHRIEKRPEWLEFAEHIFRYLQTHGRDAQGRWQFRLDAAGNVLEGPTSIYVDGFVLAGLTQFYAATGDAEAREMALATFESTHDRIAVAGSYGVAPYDIPAGLKTHGVCMVFALVYFELGRVLGRADIEQAGVNLAQEILDDFYVPEKNAILEFVDLAGRPVDSDVGRTCVPGHAIESLWFLISIFERLGDGPRIQLCCRLIRRHLELGWDDEHGGLLLAIDIDGREPPYWKNPTCKPWWAQVEALVATAYAHVHSGEAWCLQWHRRVQQFAFSRYPVPSGEWSNWVDRQGVRMASAALPVKDPFHLPRGLLHLIDLFDGAMRPNAIAADRPPTPERNRGETREKTGKPTPP